MGEDTEDVLIKLLRQALPESQEEKTILKEALQKEGKSLTEEQQRAMDDWMCKLEDQIKALPGSQQQIPEVEFLETFTSRFNTLRKASHLFEGTDYLQTPEDLNNQ